MQADEHEKPVEDREGRERVLLAVLVPPGEKYAAELEELAALVESAGGEVIEVILQQRKRPVPGTYFGKGKVEEIARAVEAYAIDLVVVGGTLSPRQLMHLEETLDTKVIDRNQLILDLFAQRARSNAGRLQVQLAQLKYSLPRLQGLGLMLSRLGGGIGTRGPGETQLEVGRRRVREQISRVEKKLKQLAQARKLQRRQRKRRGLFTFALVGYTNAGKTTLFNALTGAKLYADDRLFATLDPTIRILKLPSGRQVLLSDTVGFLRDLPPQLVAAFHSTLEATLEADVLLHVTDLSAYDHLACIKTVQQTLKTLGAAEIPQVLVANKVDLLSDEDRRELLATLPFEQEALVPCSAKSGWGLERLLEVLDEFASRGLPTWRLRVPYPHLGSLEQLREALEILEETYLPSHYELTVRARAAELAQLPREIEREQVDGAEGGT